MPLKKMEFEREKVIMPDGRYLLFYNFDQVPIGSDEESAKSNQNKENEEK